MRTPPPSLTAFRRLDARQRSQRNASTRRTRALSQSFLASFFDKRKSDDTSNTLQLQYKQNLLALLEQKAPQNAPTSAAVTAEILEAVRQLEQVSMNDDASSILPKLAGTWELLWTAQDKSRPESRGPLAWLNPLENQSYINNPTGRSAPVLPRAAQDRLESMGIIRTTQEESTVRATQAIDLKKQQARNVVSFQIPWPSQNGKMKQASVTVLINFEPVDEYRIDVKFESCRIQIPGTFVNVLLSLSFIGPSGWLRTQYVDEDLRITRGHKGSVFILSRTKR